MSNGVIAAILATAIVGYVLLKNKTETEKYINETIDKIKDPVTNYRGQPNQLAKELERVFVKSLPPGKHSLKKSEIESAMMKIAQAAFLHEFINKKESDVKNFLS